MLCQFTLISLRTGQSDIERKFKQIQSLTRSLLPKERDSPELHTSVDDLISDDEPASLQALRAINLTAGAHDHTWHESIHNCSVSFRTGDVGFIPRTQRELGFDAFVKVRNIFDDSPPPPLALVRETTGQQSQWVNGFMQRQDSWPFVLPYEVEGYVYPDTLLLLQLF